MSCKPDVSKAAYITLGSGLMAVGDQLLKWYTFLISPLSHSLWQDRHYFASGPCCHEYLQARDDS